MIRWFVPLAVASSISYVFGLPAVFRVPLIIVAGAVSLGGIWVATGVYIAALHRFGNRPRYSYSDTRNG
jgi:hypothetical protein